MPRELLHFGVGNDICNAHCMQAINATFRRTTSPHRHAMSLLMYLYTGIEIDENVLNLMKIDDKETISELEERA